MELHLMHIAHVNRHHHHHQAAFSHGFFYCCCTLQKSISIPFKFLEWLSKADYRVTLDSNT
jgi:hypothetical protein